MLSKVSRGCLIILLLLIPAHSLASPIEVNVPIFVPADIPVSGWVCLPNEIASGLKAKLYVDGEFVEEGDANQTGCYRVTLPPLPPGKHNLFAEIYKGPVKVTTISVEVTALPNMIYIGPDPLAEMTAGERINTTLIIKNRSPVNLQDIVLEITSPVPMFGQRMTRRDNVLRGKLGDLPSNGTLNVPLTIAVPKTFYLKTGTVNVKIYYRIGDFTYGVEKEVTFKVKPSPTKATQITRAARTTSSTEASTTTQAKVRTTPEISQGSENLWLIIPIITILLILIAAFVLLMRRK